MKISQIPSTVFSEARDWSALGFNRLPDYSNLYSHNAWPGLLFRRVSSALQATVFGGVIIGDNGREMILASNRSRGIMDWNCGHTKVAFEFRPYASPFFVRDDKLGYFKCDANAVSALNYPGINPLYSGAEPDWTPTWGMAVVTPNSMVGYRKLGNGGHQPATVNPAWYRELTFGQYANDIAIQSNGGVGMSFLDGLNYYLVQWCEIPFAKDGADFVRKAIPALANSYPAKIKSQMSSLMTKVADDAAYNPAGPSVFVLTQVKTSSNDPGVWGGRPRAIYSRGSRYQAYVSRGSFTPDGTQPPNDANFGDVEGPLFDAQHKTLLVPGDIRVAGGFAVDRFPAKMAIASNMTLDMTKLLKDFAPLSEVPKLSGEGNYWDLIEATTVNEGAISERDAMVNRSKKFELVAPLGSRSVEVDLTNLLVRSEAMAMDERVYSAVTGTAFGDGSGQGQTKPLVVQDSGYIYTNEIASARGDTKKTAVGALVYEKEGTFTVPETGTYSVIVQARGSAWGSIKENSGKTSCHGPVVERTQLLTKGSVYRILSSAILWPQVPHTMTAIDGPGLVANAVGANNAYEPTYPFGEGGAPAHGIVGENGIVLGTKGEVNKEPGQAAVIIRLLSNI